MRGPPARSDAEVRDLVRGHAGDVAALERDPPLGGPHEAHDALERGGLADPVAPEEPDHLAGLHFQGDAVEDVALGVVGVDVGQREHQPFR